MPAPRPPKAPRFNLRSIRSRESVDLDGSTVRPRGYGGRQWEVPPFQRWDAFYAFFEQHWEQGDHVALVGRTKSGKTTLARAILPIRGFTVVFATKAEDASLYTPLQKQGFVMQEHFDPADKPDEGEGPSKIIFKPPLRGPSKKDVEKQREAFREALQGMFSTGGWACYFDEIRYLSQNLALGNELDQLWLQGRSMGITMIAATQRPVSVPLNMFEQASHFFLWRTTDAQDRKRASEYVGVNAPMANELIGGLPRHECLYVDAVDDHAVRTMVQNG